MPSKFPLCELYMKIMAKFPLGIEQGIFIVIGDVEYPPPLEMLMSGVIGLNIEPKLCPVIGAEEIVNERSSGYAVSGTVTVIPFSGSPVFWMVIVPPPPDEDIVCDTSCVVGPV